MINYSCSLDASGFLYKIALKYYLSYGFLSGENSFKKMYRKHFENTECHAGKILLTYNHHVQETLGVTDKSQA